MSHIRNTKMKIKTATKITFATIIAAAIGSLASWAGTKSEVNAPGYNLRQAATNMPTGTTPPQYQIFDIGVVLPGDEFSQGFGVSPTAGIAVGRSLNNSGSEAFSWTPNGGIVGLPN